jgi:serine/threonine protein kinase
MQQVRIKCNGVPHQYHQGGGATGGRKDKQRIKTVGHYQLDRTLGNGTFGKVKLAVDTISKEKVHCIIIIIITLTHTMNSSSHSRWR